MGLVLRMRDNRLLSPQQDGEIGPVANSAGDWLTALRRYLVVIAFGNLAWEFAQLPLYTIWYAGSSRQIVFAALHCTGGDLLIAGTALFATLLILADGHWPHSRYRTVAAGAVLAGIAYTIFSEWLNTEIRGSWAYTEFMPRLPLIGTGIAPLLQWIIVPNVAFWWAYRPFAGLHNRTKQTSGRLE